MTDGNDLAFPFVETCEMQGESISFGFTKRELFAAMAMQGLLANPGGPIQANGMSGWSIVNCEPINVGRTALGMADALIAALNEATP